MRIGSYLEMIRCNWALINSHVNFPSSVYKQRLIKYIALRAEPAGWLSQFVILVSDTESDTFSIKRVFS